MSDDRRDMIVKALKKAGAKKPTADDIDTAAAQLDAILPAETPVPTQAQAELAVARGAECRQRGAEKFARLAARRKEAIENIAKLKAERQKHRDERRKLQARRAKRKGAGG